MKDAEDVLVFGPRPPRRSAPESLISQAEEDLRAVAVFSSMLSDRLRLLRSGARVSSGRPGLPAAPLVALTATTEAMIDATDAVYSLADPSGATVARRLVEITRRQAQAKRADDEPPRR